MVGFCGKLGFLVFSRKWREGFKEKLEYKEIGAGKRKKIEAGRIPRARRLKFLESDLKANLLMSTCCDKNIFISRVKDPSRI